MADDLDPFGRKKGEDPLASLGWGSSEGEPAAEASVSDSESADAAQTGFGREPAREPQPDRQPDGPPPPPPPPPRPREQRPPRGPQAESKSVQFGVGRAVRGLVILGILVAVGGGAISAFVNSGVDRVDRFVREFTTPQEATPEPSISQEVPSGAEQPTPPPPNPARAAVPTNPRGVGRGSLLRPYAFGAAIKRLRSSGLGRLANLRVAPERIDATLLTKAGSLRHVQIVPGGTLRKFGSAGATGFSGVPTMSLAGIDAGAPQRLTRSAAERLRVPASRVNYLVYTQVAGAGQWGVYFTGGQIVLGDAQGRITRRIN